MTRYPALYQWNGEVAKCFPHLSKPMAACLALWSLGMIIARSCALTAIAWTWTRILGQKFYTLRERLRDLYREGDAKAGDQRSTLELSVCWAPWLQWVLRDWHNRQVPIALDATSLGSRFTVLTISVLYRGSAIPVAWKIVAAQEEHAWQPEWEHLLHHFQEVVPANWKVVVMADRGLYCKRLFETITGLGWHPLLRINSLGKYRPRGWYHWRSLEQVVRRKGQRWQDRATVFKNAAGQLECTLLACWEEGHEGPWLVVTDLSPQAADVCWYGLRAWIEQSFKQIKSGGWQWQRTRMTDPERAERLWLAVALATWWLLTVGAEAEDAVRAETMEEAPNPPDPLKDPPTLPRRTGQWKLATVFRLGMMTIVAALLRKKRIPLARSRRPPPWPTMLDPAIKT